MLQACNFQFFLYNLYAKPPMALKSTSHFCVLQPNFHHVQLQYVIFDWINHVRMKLASSFRCFMIKLYGLLIFPLQNTKVIIHLIQEQLTAWF